MHDKNFVYMQKKDYQGLDKIFMRFYSGQML